MHSLFALSPECSSPVIYMVHSLTSAGPCWHISSHWSFPQFPSSNVDPSSCSQWSLSCFLSLHSTSHILHAFPTHFVCLYSETICWMWPIEGKHLSEFYLPHAWYSARHCSWCPQIGVKASVRGSRWWSGDGTPAGFPLNQRWNLKAPQRWSLSLAQCISNTYIGYQAFTKLVTSHKIQIAGITWKTWGDQMCLPPHDSNEWSSVVATQGALWWDTLPCFSHLCSPWSMVEPGEAGGEGIVGQGSGGVHQRRSQVLLYQRGKSVSGL